MNGNHFGEGMAPCIGLGAFFTFLPLSVPCSWPVRPSLLAPFIPDYRFRIAAHQSKAPRVATRREPFPSGIILLSRLSYGNKGIMSINSDATMKSL